jgi:2,3,4,5-tetrahydropyridine-2-carboxylate N-succinyltransferase
MVEGRISSSAIVGAGSDVGGGASILGVLSGTDGNPISIGENTLLGANSTCGIPLGDACIIDGGVAIFAGTKLSISSEELSKIKEANPRVSLEEKASYRADALQGLNGLHFRQDSMTGMLLVKRSTRKVVLNADLH